jgi:dienelactone hydrolase
VVVRIVVTALVAVAVAACSPGGPSPTTGTPAATATASGGAGSTGSDAEVAAIARAFVEALASGDTATAEAMEDETMRSAAPAAALGQLWDQVVAQFGAYQGIGAIETASKAPFVNATIATSFAGATVPLIVTVDQDGRVAGLHLGQPGPAASGPSATPAPSVAAASPAAYVDSTAFTETEVTVGASPWTLAGTLSMPAGAGPFPAVVLLAGSGPNDRDETIGPNAPLRDIAGGLASSGIAVLRYDKRTKVYGAAMAADPARVTVREETVDDAVAAVDLLRRTPGVDPDRVFVVGHSLGGFLAPRVAAQANGTVAGIGMLEANTSPLQHMVLDQYEYLASDAGGSSPEAAAALPAIRDQVALVDGDTLSASTPASSLPLGVPAAYWLDLREYDPAETAAGLAIPMFISQGGRDYQVPPSELAGWRSALAGRTDVTIREYPALNHLLIAGTGPSRPAEYGVPGHVDPALVADLAAWVKVP